jgi:hypothetical protein
MSVLQAPRPPPLPEARWLGVQQPRFWTAPDRHRDKDADCRACAVPEYHTGCGDYLSADLLSWAPEFGYDLDEWQAWYLTESCGTKPDGKWAAFETMLIAPRQNGKNGAVEVREIGGLYLFGERMQIHTAHEFLRPPPSISGGSVTPLPTTMSCAAGSRPSPPATAMRRSSSAPPPP